MNISQLSKLTGTMPAQWEEHWGTLMALPFDNELWFGKLDAVRAEYSALVLEIARNEKVLLVVPPSEFAELSNSPLGNAHGVYLFPFALNDAWVRDSGPIFLKPESDLNSKSDFFALDFIFNAWGHKFSSDLDDKLAKVISDVLRVRRHRLPFVFEGGSLDVNGMGAALTTKQCLLEKERNPAFTQAEIDACLKHLFEIDELVWLGEGLKGDHTDGHIDTIARFVNQKTVVCHVAEDKAHPSYAALRQNFESLEQLVSSSKSRIQKVVPLPVPKKVVEFEGEFVPFSYANFYFCNSGLIVPQFDDKNDAVVLNILQELLPGKKVIGLPASALVLGGGVFNCLTQQIPRGAVQIDTTLSFVP